ncbi:MAG: oligosaccharide flippase family protein, partial [Rhodospirillales bacterium]|nr:oligosaccharide flippase family protein [Rhodospirillales bacterium]
MKNRIITGTVQILSGQAASVALTLLRNIILARLLGLEQFGIGLTFAITISFLEMAASFSFDKFIIQDKQGEDPVLLGTTHGFVLARGILIALALVLAGDLIAFAFGLPDLAWAYQVLALAPLCGGLCHADVARFQRRLRYAPLVATQLVSEVCGLLVGIALAWWLGDYRSMLYAIVARYIAFAVLSHFVAEGPYRITFESEIARRIWRFG